MVWTSSPSSPVWWRWLRLCLYRIHAHTSACPRIRMKSNRAQLTMFQHSHRSMDARRTVDVVMDDEIVVYISVEWRLMQIYYETIYSFLSTTFLSLSVWFWILLSVCVWSPPYRHAHWIIYFILFCTLALQQNMLIMIIIIHIRPTERHIDDTLLFNIVASRLARGWGMSIRMFLASCVRINTFRIEKIFDRD